MSLSPGLNSLTLILSLSVRQSRVLAVVVVMVQVEVGQMEEVVACGGGGWLGLGMGVVGVVWCTPRVTGLYISMGTWLGGGGGVGTRPWWSVLLACGGAYWPLALEPSAMTTGWGGVAPLLPWCPFPRPRLAHR